MTDNLLDTPFTPLYADQVDEWEEVMGYSMPSSVVGTEAEYTALRTAVAVQDYSMLYKWFIEGPDARATVDALFSRDVTDLPVNGILYGVVVNDDGGMADDVTVVALGQDSLLVMGGNPEVLDALRAAAPAGTVVEERRESYGVLTIQGPLSRTLLQRLTEQDLSNEAFPYYTALTEVNLAGVPVSIFRLGFTAELGYEVMVPTEGAATLYEAVFAQNDLGVQPFAGGTLMIARIEAGLMLADVDYDSTVTPYECRLGWAVDLKKAPFRGQQALAAREADAPYRIVSVVSDASPEAIDGAALFNSGQEVGHVTMAVPSPILGGKTLGLARVLNSAAPVGTQLTVSLDGAVHAVDVRPTPVHDPDRVRVRS